MNMFKNLLLWLVVAAIFMSLFSNFGPQHTAAQRLTYSQFVESVHKGEVRDVTITQTAIRGTMSDNRHFITDQIPGGDPNLINELLNKNVSVKGKYEQQSWLSRFFLQMFPIVLLILVWIYILRQMQGGGGKGGPMSFGRSRARMLTEDQIKITFADVAGCEEAKEEVKELVDFLKDPGKFQKVGGKIPCGVLMVGQPGTGKTLLARAVAGEAKVPFFTISGSDFVEMFVGVGASRVRDMFEQAKKHAPCIIFIDEIDAVGRQRGAGLGGGHDEREQTLNQLLVEMDGFEGKEGVIVIAATNRPDVLDPALLRPGRFDRQVVVPLPDIRGREQILIVHMQKVPLSDDVSARDIARGTPGFSGADLANLVNEAALFTARANKRVVTMAEFEHAKDKIMMGAERKSMVMSDQDKKNTAYHEAGHAIVGLIMPEHDPVHKVTIIPRGRALGVTFFLPEEDKYSHTRRYLEGQIATAFGGRIAEDLIFGHEQVTTGASNDIEKATEIARNMVTKWGLSDKLGPLTYGEEQDEIFLGRSVSQRKEVSDTTAHIIDEEVREIVDRNYKLAEKILKENIETLHKMAEALIKYETIDKTQIADIMAGKEPQPPAGWIDVGPPTPPTSGGKTKTVKKKKNKDQDQDKDKDKDKDSADVSTDKGTLDGAS